MKYQTLLTPPRYVHQIWIAIFLLHGLFIYASVFHNNLQHSSLVGYSLALSEPKQSVAAHYPAACAVTLMTIYAHDSGFVFCAFVSSVFCALVLGNVIKIQGQLLDEMEAQAAADSGGYVKEGDDDLNASNLNVNNFDDIKARALQYLCLRLPFELHGGYSLALVAMYFNTFLHSSFESLPTMVYLVVANASLLGLLFAGFMILWKIPGRKLYGAGASLVWYLLGMAIELHTPTQPIYNEYSDNAILTTQIVATVATTVLMILLGVRVNKTMIKYNVFDCVGTFGGCEDNESVVSEDKDGGISADYVHA